MAVDGPDRGLYRPEHRLGWALPFVPLGGVQFRGCHVHVHFSPGRCSDAAGTASSHSDQPRRQAACAAAPVVLSRHARAAMATLEILPVNVGPHSHWLAPRPAHQCLDECRGRDRCKADSDGIAHSIRLQATVQRCRSFSLVCAAGAQDVCAITHLKSPWPVSPSLSALSSSHGRRISGQMRCSSYSSVWKRSAPGANASVDLGSTQTIGQLWEEYFADASQWCDNRVDKKNPRSPDFKHKVTRKALWIDGWSTPVWVKARLTPVTQGTLQCDVGHDTRDSQDTTQGKRLRMGNNGEGNTLPTSARERRQIAQGGGGSVHVQSASTTSEAIAILKNRLQQGMTIDSYTYVDVLKRCSKQKDLLAAKQVHDCIIKSGMDQNTYVGTSLLSVYIRCGRLQDARRVFDGLLKKDVISWKVMIGGYAERNHANDAMEVFLQMREENVEADEITYLRILKACGNPLALKWGKEVHAYIRDGGLESNVRVGTALLQMYAKCGCIKEARQIFDNLTNADVFSWNVMIGAYVESGSIHDARLVFDRMEERDVITWNVMIGAYAESGCGEEAYGLFLQMKREGLKPNAITYISILNACASAGALEWVKEVHGQALEAGLESDLRVGNALIHMYSKCGSIDDARLVFDRMVKRDVITWNVTIGAYVEIGSIHDARLIFDRMERRDIITWNVMIGAYAKSGCGEEAYRLFLQMKREGLKPDAFTYTSILNARSSAGALEWVKEVHGHAVEAGLESDVRVGNALIHMYSKSGSTDDARVVFDRMVKRDAITWNVTIGAYVEIGSIHDARLIFDRMERRDIITWNVMIGAYAKSGCGEEAYRLFLQMKREGLKPDAFTYSSILNACASAGALEWVKEVHGHALEAGLESDVRVGNALIHMYAKCGSIDDARVVFDRMVKRDVITWTVMIGAYAESGCGEEAYRLFLRMKREGLKPNAITYISILNACASAGALEWVKEVHGHAVEAGLESDLPVGNALVHMYAKCGSIDDARILFGRMEVRDVITWNVMIGGLAQHGCGQEALEEFRNMNGDGVKPDGRSLVAVLSACSHAGLLDDGRRLFLAMTQDYGIKPDTVLCNCMVDLLGRAGHLEEAMIFIRNMPVAPNGATWGALLGACRTHGNVEMAEIAAAESLKLEGSHAGTYVLLSNIYAAAGKWDQVSLVRTMMQERGIRKEPGRSWIEVDNKIHRFVVGDTSHPETKEIYAELNRLTERIKAEGYIPDTRLVLQNIDEEDKELALCSHSEKLAIAYGLMRTRDGKPIRVYKNLRVCSDCHTATKFISKVTGREIVARDANRFHHFNEGVCSCGDYW